MPSATRTRARCSSFNEAGADAPEIPSESHRRVGEMSGFNEAGADAPEIPPHLKLNLHPSKQLQ